MANRNTLAKDGKYSPNVAQVGGKNIGRKGSREGAARNKEIVLGYRKKGIPIARAMEDLGLSVKTYEYWRRTDPNFRQDMDRLKAIATNPGEGRAEGMPSFEDFCMKYLDTQLFNHHLQWIDLLEDREPRNLHESQVYSPGEPEVLIINTPPEHAKSTTVTINYVTYRICEDPNVRIIIVSKTQEMAKRFLRAVKDRLAGTNSSYSKLQMDFAPEGGFDANSSAWTASEIYVSGDSRDSGEKDPTVRAVGIRGQIYGARADLIVMDDCVDMGNAHDFAKQIDWIQNEIMSRLAVPGGKLLLVGTRLAPVDLYVEIQKPEYYSDDDSSPWTYLTQPAVLEFSDDAKEWVTLWPRTNRPPVSLKAKKLVEQAADGTYPMWDGPALQKKRSKMSPRNWAMVYMQEQVIEDAIFPVAKVVGCVNGMRQPGPLVGGAPGHRAHGMEGTYVIGGFDPAMTGHSASIVMAVDRYSGERWVLDCWTKPHCKPDDIFDKIKELTVKYRINEWRIEKNAMNLMVTQSSELRKFMAQRGCLLKEHFTGKNKWDTDFGVASMSMLFDGHETGRNLIKLPNRGGSEGVKALVEQLTTWFPETKSKTDLVMALWFAEIRARELCDQLDNQFTIPNRYLSQRDREKVMTVDLDYASQAAMQSGNGGWS
jgi:hypothetical protein